jgi:hypothetical protein
VMACGSPNKIASTSTRTAASVPGPTSYLYQGDGDADNPGDLDGDAEKPTANMEGGFKDADPDEDATTKASLTYHDKDDLKELNYGQPASAADGQAVTETVTRYYTAAAKADGATGCSLLVRSLSSSVVEDYGGRATQPYLQGSKTCKELMSKLFRHVHSKVLGRVTVTSVRVEGNQAEAMIESRTMPASQITVERKPGGWRMAELFSTPLP